MWLIEGVLPNLGILLSKLQYISSSENEHVPEKGTISKTKFHVPTTVLGDMLAFGGVQTSKVAKTFLVCFRGHFHCQRIPL